uniref:Seed maturation protein n=1 Tax=Panagrolaimus sp. ES5 TaxID=591445 RepID=A0AC34FZZ7_9BILA
MSERRQSIGEKISEGIHAAADYATGKMFSAEDKDNSAPNSTSGVQPADEKYGVKSESPAVSTGASAAQKHQMAN